MDAAVFYLSAIVAVISSMIVVTRRNPIYSAIWLVTFFLAISTGFLVLRAPFLAVIQVLVYGGAIMVLFLFVLMLLNLSPEELREQVSRRRKIFAGLGSVALFVLLVGAIRGSTVVANAPDLTAPIIDPRLATAGEVHPIAESLFRDHVLAFELTSILIFVAIVGAIYLTKTRRAGRLEAPAVSRAPVSVATPSPAPAPDEIPSAETAGASGGPSASREKS